MSGPGSVFTSPLLAKPLVDWAIHSPKLKVLDLGIGDGVFTILAIKRMVKLGYSKSEVNDFLFGSEISKESFNSFKDKLKKLNISLKNIKNQDFFEYHFPKVDVVIGNPPYVRRASILNYSHLKSLFEKGLPPEYSFDLNFNQDLYVLFLLRGLTWLKPGGNFSVIIPDTWLYTSYGATLRKFLLQSCEEIQIISPDQKLFNDAMVKSIILIGKKKEHNESMSNKKISFVRLKKGFKIKLIGHILNRTESQLNGHKKTISSIKIEYSKLSQSSNWIKESKTFNNSINFQNSYFTKISNICKVGIGIQTLANDFFILDDQKIKENKIEEKFFCQLASSPKQFNLPVIKEENQISAKYLLFCSESKENLCRTNVIEYIKKGESKIVSTRGKNDKIVGYQNKDRIIRAKRKFWYDLKTKESQKNIPPILLPRLIFSKYYAFYNQEKFLPGEGFVRVLPTQNKFYPAIAAILSSSFTEFEIRKVAQLYGGGTLNLGIRELKSIQVINWEKIEPTTLNQLELIFLDSSINWNDRIKMIDNILVKVLKISNEEFQLLRLDINSEKAKLKDIKTSFL